MVSYVPSSSKRVSINSQYFSIAEDEDGNAQPIQVYDINVRADARRFAGQSQRSDNVKVDRWTYPWKLGIGFERMDREDERGVGGLRDADANTLHRIASAPLAANSTDSSSNTDADFLQFFIEWKGDLWAFGEETYSGSTTGNISAVKFQASDDTWRGGGSISGDLSNAAGIRVFDATTHKDSIWMVVNRAYDGGAETELEVHKASSIDSFATATGSGFTHQAGSFTTTTTRRNLWGDHGYAKLLGFGNTLYLAAFAVDESLVRVQKTTDGGSNWSVVTTIPATNAAVGAFVAWKDPFTAGLPAIPVLILGDGVYKIDDANSTFAEIFRLNESATDGDWFTGSRATVAADGNLYIPVPGGDIIRLSVPQEGVIAVSNCGPGTHSGGEANDGLVPARQGNVNAVFGGNSRYLFVAYGKNGASSYGSIFAMDYDTKAWHSIYLDATADRVIHAVAVSAEDDGTLRVHWAGEATENAGTSVQAQIENALSNPAAGGLVYRSGYMQFATDDLGDPNADSAVFQALIDADNLATGATGAHIEWFYATTGTAWTTTDAGDFFNTSKSIVLGSNLGVSTKKISNHLDLNVPATTASNGPLLADFEIQARNKVNILEGFIVPIDILKTAQNEGITPEDVLARLRTIRQSITLVPFVFGEDGSNAAKTYYVEAVPDSSGDLTLESPQAVGLGGTIDQTERIGIYSLQLEEVYK